MLPKFATTRHDDEIIRKSWSRERRRALIVVLVWTMCVLAALGSTLQSLRQSEFDGLNNLFQIPFALPWFLIPIGTSNNFANAYEAAGCGLLNGVLIYAWMMFLAHRKMTGRNSN